MTDISSVSGLRGVRERIAEALWWRKELALALGHTVDYEGDLPGDSRIAALNKELIAALSLPPSPQPPDERDFKRPEGLYLKFAEPLMEPNTPVIIERVNGDCTVSQFIIARDEAHELIDQLRELLAAPAGAQGQVQGVQRDEIVIDALRDHWPTWIKGEGIVEQMGVCSCGKAKADGVTPYKKLWSEHMEELVRAAIAVPPADVSSQAGQTTMRDRFQHELYENCDECPPRKDVMKVFDRALGGTREMGHHEALGALTDAFFGTANKPSNPHPEITEAVTKAVQQYRPTLSAAAAPSAGSGQDAMSAIPDDVDTLISRILYGEDIHDVRRKVAGYLERALLPPASKPQHTKECDAQGPYAECICPPPARAWYVERDLELNDAYMKGMKDGSASKPPAKYSGSDDHCQCGHNRGNHEPTHYYSYDYSCCMCQCKEFTLLHR